MRKNVVKSLALLLTLASLTSVFAACQKKTGEPGAGTPGTTAKEPQKPDKIKAFVDTFMVKEQGHDQLIEEYKKQTGITLEITQPAHNQYYDVLNVTFASGDIPDVVEIAEQNYLKYATQGGLADLTQQVKNSKVLQAVEPAYMDALKVSGKQYGVPLQTGGGCVTYIRQDWLDNLGLKVPTTYDELYNVMKAFTFNDPDKNGKNDTIGYTSVLVAEGKLQEQYLRDFYWDSSPDFVLKDGKWVDGFSQPEYMEGLLRVKKAYQDKILDQELFTNQTSTARDKFTASKVGIFPYWNNYWASRLEDTTKQSSAPNAKLVAIPAIKESYYLNRAPVATAITSKSKNVDGVFKWFVEYMHDGGPGQTLFSYGVENVHWQKKDNKVEALPILNNPKQKFDKVWFSADNTVTPYTNGPLIPLDPRITQAIDAFKGNFKQVKIFPASDTYTKVSSDLYKLRQEVASKIIIGELTPEQGMARYNTDAKKIGVDKILTEFNSAAQ